jgi:hypothetical protein
MAQQKIRRRYLRSNMPGLQWCGVGAKDQTTRLSRNPVFLATSDAYGDRADDDTYVEIEITVVEFLLGHGVRAQPRRCGELRRFEHAEFLQTPARQGRACLLIVDHQDFQGLRRRILELLHVFIRFFYRRTA